MTVERELLESKIMEYASGQCAPDVERAVGIRYVMRGKVEGTTTARVNFERIDGTSFWRLITVGQPFVEE